MVTRVRPISSTNHVKHILVIKRIVGPVLTLKINKQEQTCADASTHADPYVIPVATRKRYTRDVINMLWCWDKTLGAVKLEQG